MQSTSSENRAAASAARETRASASNNIEPLWNAADLARFLKVSKSWVYQASAAGVVPCVRIGAALRFEPEAIRRWLHGGGEARVVQLPNCR
ncbi:MAG: hypothetical protein AMXMBFR34_07050 [Myxococcaceae bacterium]